MKNLISVILSAMMLTSILSACGGTSQNSGTSSAGGDAYRITIVQPMSHTSLDQIRDTIVAELNASGKNIVIGTKNANGDTTALGTILENCKAEGVDLVIPIATSTAQSAKAVFDGTGIPIVFAAVSDPAAADLPYETLSDYAKFVNLQAASRFGASFPESAYAGYEVLVEADGTSHFGQ